MTIFNISFKQINASKVRFNRRGVKHEKLFRDSTGNDVFENKGNAGKYQIFILFIYNVSKLVLKQNKINEIW